MGLKNKSIMNKGIYLEKKAIYDFVGMYLAAQVGKGKDLPSLVAVFNIIVGCNKAAYMLGKIVLKLFVLILLKSQRHVDCNCCLQILI